MKNILKDKYLLWLIAIFSVIRITGIAFMGLMPQDAYYTYYSENLALSYFDHPPMVAYMIAFFTSFLGKSAVALHTADFVTTTFSLIFLYLFLKEILVGSELKRALILLIPAPLITILSINTTPDVPLIFFWSLSLLLSFKAVTKGNWYWWVTAGITAGLSFTSKYTGIFMPAGMFLFLLLSKEHRKSILSYKFLLYAFAVLIAVSPVIIWNIQNDFISLRYQSADRAAGLSSFEFDPLLLPGFLGSQMLLVLPMFLVFLYVASFDVIKKYLTGKSLNNNMLFAAAFAVPMLAGFTAIAIVYWVKINWVMPVFISGVVLAARYIKNDKFIRWQVIFSVIVHILMLAQLIWMPVMVKSDDTWWGWKELHEKVEELQQENPEKFIFSDNSYKISAVLNFYCDQHIYAGNVIDKFAFQFALDNSNLSHLEGKNAIYVTSNRYRRKNLRRGSIESMLKTHFAKAHLKDSLVLEKNGVTHRKFYFYQCEDYGNPTAPDNVSDQK